MERRQEKIKKLAIDLVVDVLGGLMLAIAIYSFAVPANFPMTGVSGIALVFYHLFGASGRYGHGAVQIFRSSFAVIKRWAALFI